jgi:hypothetical protein
MAELTEQRIKQVENRLAEYNWTDANSVILYAYSKRDGGEEAAALFTLKFDKAGNSKIVQMHRMSKKELEEEQ